MANSGYQSAVDDVSGATLEPERVQAARKEELEYIHRMGVYVKVDRREAWAAGIQPIQVRWIDVNKGDSEQP
eukprot:8318524-Lingulodinium_polyedra.AAC.1